MKLRLLVMRGIISTIGVALLVARNFSASFIGLLGIGILLFVVGLLWN